MICTVSCTAGKVRCTDVVPEKTIVKMVKLVNEASHLHIHAELLPLRLWAEVFVNVPAL